MKNLIKTVPLPLAGVMLGFAALGNLLQSYSESLRLACGGISFILLLLLILKLIMFPKLIAEDLKNPILASVSATFPMGIMLLSVYAKPFIGGFVKYIWLAAIALHMVLIAYFTVKFMVKPDMKKVFASYFIVYVGIAAAGVSSPAFEMQALGSVLVWFSIISVLALLVFVSYRYVKFKEVPDPAKPLFCIYTAPVSLCLAGYIQSSSNKSSAVIGALAVLSMLIYVVVLVKTPKYLKLPFYPSYASFTFPFIISAIATKQTMAYLAKINMPMPMLKYVVLAQTIIAAVLALYTLVKFVMFMTKQSKQNR